MSLASALKVFSFCVNEDVLQLTPFYEEMLTIRTEVKFELYFSPKGYKHLALVFFGKPYRCMKAS